MPDWTNSQGQIVYNSDSPPAFGGPWWQATPDEASKGQQQGQQGQQQSAAAPTQQFGGLPQSMYGNYLVPTNAAATGQAMSNAMARKAPSIAGVDLSGMGKTQQSQMGVLGQLQGYAQGLGPSAAQIGNTMAMGQAAQAARAGVAGGNPLASRAALGVQQSALGGAAMQGAAARGQEQAGAMNAYGGAAGGLTQQSLGAGQLTQEQIEQQQALGLGQAQRNYQLAQGILGTSTQEQVDNLKFLQGIAAINQQKQNDITNNEIKVGASAASAAGSAYTYGSK